MKEQAEKCHEQRIEVHEDKKAKKKRRRNKKDADAAHVTEFVVGAITTTMGNTEQGLIADEIDEGL